LFDLTLLIEMDQPDETKNDPAATENAVATADPKQQKNSKPFVYVLTTFGLVAAIVLIVVLVVLLGNGSSPEQVSDWAPGFSTGVSLITSYAIDVKVRSRLATTQVTMEVANALNCASVHVVTLQLPLNTRVTSLQTSADNGCTSSGEVQEIQDAKDTFEEQVTQGLPAAFVEVDDAVTYSVQVSIPPLGTTTVTLVLEQILQQQLGELAFQFPLIPNEEVDKVVLDLSVQDVSGNPVEFLVDLDIDIDIDDTSNITTSNNSTDKNAIAASGTLHLDIPDVRQYDLPRVVRGRYNPGVLPESGFLHADDRCFEHFFVPNSLEGMARNIFFLLDTSNGMRGYKLSQTKEALNSLIDTLTPRDTFTIQTFAESGTEELWGPGPGIPDEKEEAKKFVNALNSTYWRTNLNEALLEGLLRAKSAADKRPEDTATIMFVISDSYGREGERDRSKIAKHVYELNSEGTVKIFTMGFQESADMTLLDAIALLNGGISAPINQASPTEIKTQIVDFFSSWLGNILLSDVNVDLVAENTRVFGETQQAFSLLSAGYEVVVRGLLEVTNRNAAELPELRAVTSAATLSGASKWEAVAPITGFDTTRETASLCFQSYAHARVTQLMRLYEASEFIDHNILLEFVTLANPDDCDAAEKVECLKAEALTLALEAKMVAKGLTAIVTVENEMCQAIDEGAEVCLDGTTPDGQGWISSASDSEYSAGTRSHGALLVLLALLILMAIAFCW